MNKTPADAAFDIAKPASSPIWEEASAAPYSIQIQKFSGTTYASDLKDPNIPATMRAAITNANVGKIWRARVGRNTRWWYGWSAEQAVEYALVWLRGKKQT